MKQRKVTWVEIVPTTPHARTQNENLKTRNQIVQSEKVQPSKTAAQNAYLGEQTQTVDRQSVNAKRATIMGKAQNVARNANSAEHKAHARSRENHPTTASAAVPVVSNLGVPMISKVQPESDQQRAHEENWAAQGGDSPQDYVKGVAESDRTLLNTKEFVFYGYYQRIRSRLDQEWVPILREKLMKYYYSGRQLASDMDHTTQVLVVMNSAGQITAVKIVSESGTQDLDDAAVEAFNEAGPFPNPPKGIVDSNGQIQIPWEFILRT